MQIHDCLKILSGLGIVGILSACGAKNVAELKDTTTDRSTFSGAIADYYRKFVKFEADEMVDWVDAGYFAGKALRILEDPSTAKPENYGNWNVDERFRGDLEEGGKRLNIAMRVLSLEEGGAQLARAISSYDCWVEQAEEGWQKDHIAECQSAFNDAFIALENQARLKFTDKGKAKASIVLHHDLDAASPRQEDLAGLQSFTERSWGDLKMHIHIEGHTDLSGSEPHNDKLSIERAIAAVNAIATPWHEEYTLSIAGLGENQPTHPTPNGVQDIRNRRTVVEISLALNPTQPRAELASR